MEKLTCITRSSLFEINILLKEKKDNRKQNFNQGSVLNFLRILK